MSYTVVGRTSPTSKVRTRVLISGIMRCLIQWWWQRQWRPRLPGMDEVKKLAHGGEKKKNLYNEISTNVTHLGWALRASVFGRWRSSWWFIRASCLPAAPEEMHLRHVEVDVLIPKLMREKAKERCVEKVEGVFVCATILSFVCARFSARGNSCSFQLGKTHGLSYPLTWSLITDQFKTR